MDLAQRRRVLGVALEALEAGLWQVAETQARTLPPDDDDGALLLGLALAGRNNIETAAALLVRVARKRPGHAHPCTDFARLCPDGPVAALYRACLMAAPDNARLRRDFAAWLLDRNAPTEAEAVLRPVPNTASAQHLLGMALTEQGRFHEAISHFRRATILDPIPSMAWANLGMVLKVEGRFAEALSAYDEAILRSPDDTTIRLNRSVALLHAGRWAEAWQDGDWRLRMPGYSGLPEQHLLPQHADVEGRTVLLTHEEGYGDTIQFLRYAPLLAERGAYAIARMPPQLVRIARTVPGIASVVAEDEPIPAYDWH
ncbi:MAG: tetratricopeptide repeat protein, partial [Rhodospirillales bacterium]